MGNFKEDIENLAEKAREIVAKRLFNEQGTVNALIMPLLRALDYDNSNPDEMDKVEADDEYSITSTQFPPLCAHHRQQKTEEQMI